MQLAANAKKTPSVPNVTDDLRHAFIPLYEHFTPDALQLSAAIFGLCVKHRAIPARAKGEVENAERWESVAAAVLDGVLVRFPVLSPGDPEPNSLSGLSRQRYK